MADVAVLLELVNDLSDTIRERAAEAETLGHLTDDVVGEFHDAGLFRVFASDELGGHGLRLPDGIAVIERCARADAATAWTLSILSSGPLFAPASSTLQLRPRCSQSRDR